MDKYEIIGHNSTGANTKDAIGLNGVINTIWSMVKNDECTKIIISKTNGNGGYLRENVDK
jgi:hypothetical protein